ncbi:MAG: hypothetical protein ACK56I_13360, partial [bacterium]
QQPVVSFVAGGHPLGQGGDDLEVGAVPVDAGLFFGGDGVKPALVGFDQAIDGRFKGLGGAVHFAAALQVDVLGVLAGSLNGTLQPAQAGDIGPGGLVVGRCAVVKHLAVGLLGGL